MNLALEAQKFGLFRDNVSVGEANGVLDLKPNPGRTGK